MDSEGPAMRGHQQRHRPCFLLWLHLLNFLFPTLTAWQRSWTSLWTDPRRNREVGGAVIMSNARSTSCCCQTLRFTLTVQHEASVFTAWNHGKCGIIHGLYPSVSQCTDSHRPPNRTSASTGPTGVQTRVWFTCFQCEHYRLDLVLKMSASLV